MIRKYGIIKICENYYQEVFRENLKIIQEDLEKGIALRDRNLSPQESEAISDTFLVSRLPLLTIVNIDETDLNHAEEIQKEVSSVVDSKLSGSMVMCALLEEELSKLSFGDAKELRTGLNVETSGLENIIKLTYSVLGLVQTPPRRLSGRCHAFSKKSTIHYIFQNLYYKVAN